MVFNHNYAQNCMFTFLRICNPQSLRSDFIKVPLESNQIKNFLENLESENTFYTCIPASKTTIMIVKKIHMVLSMIRCNPHLILIHVENLLIQIQYKRLKLSFWLSKLRNPPIALISSRIPPGPNYSVCL